MSREKESESKCTCGDVFYFLFFVVVVLIIPVTLHCYYNVFKLRVWVQFINEENNYRNFIDYIFFYHI